jgi:alpha-tubulin suppressor-like RCC1 family protein
MRALVSAVMTVAVATLSTVAAAQATAAALNWQRAAAVEGLPGPASLVAANAHTSCAVIDGALWCWGRLEPVGVDGASDKPRLIRGVRGLVQLSIGARGACGLTSAKQVLCWGPAFSSKTPKPVAGLGRSTKVSTGEGFACAVGEDRRVACWGENGESELGQLPRDPKAPPTVAAPSRRRSAADLNAELVAKAVVDHLGSERDRRRDDKQPTTPTPEPPSSNRALVVPDLDDVVDLAAGKQHACAVRASGEVVCWGDRKAHRSGARRKLPNISDAIAVSAYDRESCILLRDGAVSCFAEYFTSHQASEPRRCAGIGKIRALGDHACWAVTESGQLVRVGETSCYEGKPEPGVADAVEASGAASHGCARTSDGKVLCFGVNADGQLARPPVPALHTF